MTPSHHDFPIAQDLSEVMRMNVWLDGVMAAHGVDKTLSDEVKVCLDEAVTNVLSYAFDDPGAARADLRVSVAPDAIVARLVDAGRPFDPLSVENPGPVENIADTPIGGLGIGIMRRLASSVGYLRDGERNILTLRFDRQAPGSAAASGADPR
ncbi:ATP-binding protein [Palleronia sp. KMU-117]|uniref:ATP-binding protein n=1 Tax=Palleronia sp. KMU-117 TaxID=3434108 RepID=UPI003D73EFAD